ncbi:MAG: 3-phosphoshikimate 1-carboxyvinyltransferase, partial [Bacillota bacterium]
MEADLEQQGLSVSLKPVTKLQAKEIYVPGDISSAAFFLVLGAIAEDGQITLENVGLNPTRTGIIDVLKKMGAELTIFNQKIVNGEPMGDIFVASSELKGIEIGGDLLPRVIDEIPVIAVAAVFAKGLTTIKNAEELRVKETDRITAIVTELKKIGAKITETEDGMIIEGTGKLYGGEINSYRDHRMAMALTIAGLVSQEGVIIDDPQCVAVSYPNFWDKGTGVLSQIR